MACRNLVLDEAMQDSLRCNWVHLVTFLEPLSEILDYLEQNKVGIDRETILQSSPIRKEQVRSLLTSLKKRPYHEYWIFLKSLYSERVNQGHIAEKILRSFLESGGTINDQEVMNFRSDYLAQQPELLEGEPANRLPPRHHHLRPAAHHFHADPQPKPLDPPVPRAEGSGNACRMQLSGGSGHVANPTNEGLQMDAEESPAHGSSQEQNAGADVSEGPATQRRNMYHEKYAEEKNSVYKMDSIPRGLGLIIDNRSFDHASNRDGSEEDCNSLLELFTNTLGYEMQIKVDLKATDMLDELKRFAAYLNEQSDNIDCGMVAILTHGNENILYGTDGRLHGSQPVEGTFITVNQLKGVLDSDNCAGMQEKPKMIIIQACRGNLEDTTTGPRRYQPDMPGLDPANQRTVPRLANFVLLFATVEGQVAYRNVFIPKLVEVFEDKAHTTHVSDLMTVISRRLSEQFVNDNCFVISEERKTLLKSWYFNPPSQG